MTSFAEPHTIADFARRPWLMRVISAAALAAAYIGVAPGTAARAADLGGNCCADLEERIAELEATTARKGNRKVSLTISGQVNQSILAWDDGHESNAYVVDNASNNSLFTFSGEAAISPGLKAGYYVEIYVADNFSDGVSQLSDEAGSTFDVWQSNWFLESERYGKLTVGQAARASDGAPEVDLSEAADASYASVPDIGGGFFLRTKGGALASPAWGDLTGDLNGDTGSLVRYDSPTFKGFTFSATYGEDDIWDVATTYEGEIGGGFKLGAALAYAVTTDENGLDGTGDVPNTTIVGSFSILHEPSGLNLTVAGGNREFDEAVVDADNAFRKGADASFVYAKLGWIAKLNSLGPTAFYGDYAHFKDYLSAGLDADGVASLSFTDAANVCAGAGLACRASGSEVNIWGFGVVQHIEAAEMQVFIGYRHWTADVDLVDVGGNPVAGAGLEDFDTVIAGSRISF